MRWVESGVSALVGWETGFLQLGGCLFAALSTFFFVLFACVKKTAENTRGKTIASSGSDEEAGGEGKGKEKSKKSAASRKKTDKSLKKSLKKTTDGEDNEDGLGKGKKGKSRSKPSIHTSKSRGGDKTQGTLTPKPKISPKIRTSNRSRHSGESSTTTPTESGRESGLGTLKPRQIAPSEKDRDKVQRIQDGARVQRRDPNYATLKGLKSDWSKSLTEGPERTSGTRRSKTKTDTNRKDTIDKTDGTQTGRKEEGEQPGPHTQHVPKSPPKDRGTVRSAYLQPT